MKTGIMLGMVVLVAVTMAFIMHPEDEIGPDDSVAKTLIALGDGQPDHYIESVDLELSKMGEELVKNGRTIGPDGKKSKYISRYFVCTSCHNLEREDANLTAFNPEERIDYVEEKGLPFLQGTTFWGIVNRESWYNDDYVLKYGENVEKANKDLREAIQLCAVECSQGRRLESWELEAILHYYWTLELKIADIGADTRTLKTAAVSISQNKTNPQIVTSIKSLYALRSPATFAYPPEEKFEGYGLEGDPARGKKLYENSCLHCHMHQGVSDFVLDNSTYSFKFLHKYMPSNNQLSFYEVIRKGTYSWPGSRPYMPHYPKEKMSDQQVEDLRSYIEMRVDIK